MEQSMEQNNRLFINIARGVAIFLMLWGHCIQYCAAGSFDFFENTVFRIIYSFHMPLFMLISGYLFFFSQQKRDLKTLLIHKTQAMLQPIVMGSILTFLLCNVLYGIVRGDFTVIVGGEWLKQLKGLWFLWSVLAASVWVSISCKIVKRFWLQGIFLLAGCLFVVTMPCAKENLYMYPYFVIGFLFAKFQNRVWMQKVKVLGYISLPLFPVMMLFFKKEHYIYTTGFSGTEGYIKHTPVNLYRWAIGLVGSIFVLVLLKLLFQYVVGKFPKAKIVSCVGRLGEKSLQIYVLSVIFLSRYLGVAYEKLVSILGQNILAHNMFLYNFVYTFLIAVVYSIGLLIINRMLEKTGVSKVLFGK